ncbi:MAG: GNAT family N-acetyltransferase [Gammaproteobacteria bacterium]|nr:GNAT family N-acetyltransferase [Gammaproteobacteria bacterium]
MDVIYQLNERQISELHQLYQREWWTKDRSLAATKNCVAGSQINIGIVDNNGTLLAYARVLTDYTFKALIFDVIVSPEQRGSGLGSRLITLIKHHPALSRVIHFELYCLPEMFGFYARHGFSDDVGNIKLMRYLTES